MRALQVTVTGAVQGVGFRPFVYGLAVRHGIAGTVSNAEDGVAMTLEGPDAALATFLRDLVADAPAAAVIREVRQETAQTQGARDFRIVESRAVDDRVVLSVGADLATCATCLAEFDDPSDRRHGYPFINCTHCGPRFSIVTGSPYDRPATTMASFTMCGSCLAEYRAPSNRRFHAQPNACAECGPTLVFESFRGSIPSDDPVADAVDALRSGRVIAVQGLGGFHLMVRADADDSLAQLRDRKRRGNKPFAVMFETIDDLQARLAPVEVSAAEEALLRAPAAPIVLMRVSDGARNSAVSGVSQLVAPGSPDLGCILAYTPLHVLLLRGVGVPLVATSGNERDEPIAIHVDEVRKRLSGIVDAVLFHDRAIVRPVDDSVARVVDGRPMILRRGRGYAPLSFYSDDLPEAGVELALGAHQKATVALRAGRRVVVSPHIGDLETVAAREQHEACARDLAELMGVLPERLVCDRHPDYASTIFAERLQQGGAGPAIEAHTASAARPLIRVLHHEAHLRAVALEHGVTDAYVGAAWDGTGLGDDGTIHGGEFFATGEGGQLDRVGSMQLFVLPGGERAVREPWRIALGLLHSVFGEAGGARPCAGLFREIERAATSDELVSAKLAAQHGRVFTSSVGRLFDAVAAMLGLCSRADFEAEAAVALESCAAHAGSKEVRPYPVEFDVDGRMLHRPWLEALQSDLTQRLPRPEIALRFHRTLVEALSCLASAHGAAASATVLLSGGCFQNRLLLEHAVRALRSAGHRPLWAEALPCNDGGIAFGQIAAAARVHAPTPVNDQPVCDGAPGEARAARTKA
ncbi:MAG: carbamoyltransferase HypF [Planctomycetota bacterium]